MIWRLRNTCKVFQKFKHTQTSKQRVPPCVCLIRPSCRNRTKVRNNDFEHFWTMAHFGTAMHMRTQTHTGSLAQTPHTPQTPLSLRLWTCNINQFITNSVFGTSMCPDVSRVWYPAEKRSSSWSRRHRAVESHFLMRAASKFAPLPMPYLWTSLWTLDDTGNAWHSCEVKLVACTSGLVVTSVFTDHRTEGLKLFNSLPNWWIRWDWFLSIRSLQALGFVALATAYHRLK